MEINFTDISIPTEFDGQYLCIIDTKQECGEWIRSFKVIFNHMNQWVGVKENEFIVSYCLLPNANHYEN